MNPAENDRRSSRPPSTETRDVFLPATRHRHSGSIYGVGWKFQSFRINDLVMVDQNSASWNQLTHWLTLVEALRSAAWFEPRRGDTGMAWVRYYNRECPYASIGD